MPSSYFPRQIRITIRSRCTSISIKRWILFKLPRQSSSNHVACAYICISTHLVSMVADYGHVTHQNSAGSKVIYCCSLTHYTAVRWSVHWPLMGGLLHLVQRRGACAGCGPAQSPPRCTKCNSPPINGQCTNLALLLPLHSKGLSTSV